MQITKWSGKPISKPGWYSGIPLEDYHSARICDGYAVSSSDLRTCWSKSPAHMFARWSCNPKREVKEPTRAMQLGTAAHYLLLGDASYKLKYIGQPPTYRDKVTAEVKKWHNGADVCKEWNAKQAKAGRTPLTLAEINTIDAMAASLSLQPLVREGLLRGLVEHSGFIRDKETGLWIKVRPDVIPTFTGEFCDLKTTTDVTTPALMSTVRSFGYHQQGALIWQVCEELGQPFEAFVLAFVETGNPYCARMMSLPDPVLGRARQQNRATMRWIKASIEAGHWPGPGEDDDRALMLSNDEIARIDVRLKREGLA